MPAIGDKIDLTGMTIQVDGLEVGGVDLAAELAVLGATTSTAAELNILDGATATFAEINYLDLTTLGTGAASKAVVLDAGDDYIWPTAGVLTYGGTAVTANGAELNYLDITTLGTGAASKAVVLDSSSDYIFPAAATITNLGTLSVTGNVLTTGAGAGYTDGVGAIHKSSVWSNGTIIKTSILLDLTGTESSTTDLDVIGSGVSAAYIGRVLAAQQGTVLSGRITCLEAPTGGVTDIDLYTSTAATAVFDDPSTGMAGITAIVTAGAAWTIGLVKVFTGIPAANAYLYLLGGAAGTAATYTAGKFLIEIEGY